MIQMRGILCMDTMARSKQLFRASTEGWSGARPRTAASRSLRYACHSCGRGAGAGVGWGWGRAGSGQERGPLRAF